jgi:tetratricopeptide (TPR) repeat protein
MASFEQQGDAWLGTARLFDVHLGRSSQDLKVVGTNGFDSAWQLANRTFQELRINLTGTARLRLEQRGTASSAAWGWYGKAETFASGGKSLVEQEGCYRRAIEIDPQFAAAFDQLAALLATEGKWDDAVKMAHHALKLSASDRYAHRVLADSFWSHGQNQEAERELEAVTELDPDDAGAFARLGYLSLMEGQQSKAVMRCETAAQLEPYGPDAPLIHAMLGYIFAQQGRSGQAMAQLHESTGRVSSGDMLAEQFLANGYAVLRETALAVEHGERFIRLAKERSTFLEQVPALETLLANMKRTLTPSYITNASPQRYTEQELTDVLKRKLNPRELSLAANPLASTREVAHWAEELTQQATNRLQKAKMLCDVISRRTSPNSLLVNPCSLTAQEAYAKWREPDFLMHCQEATFLFIALARAVGIPAHVVHVDEAWDGSRSPHACAAVYADGRALLVDPTCCWFGAAHRKFRVLDDVEALAVHLSMQVDLERKQIAAKLAPELPLVQARLCADLINMGRWSEAAKPLGAMLRVDASSAISAGVQAAFAMHDGKIAKAESLLRRGLEIDPSNSSLHFQLGNVYAVGGKPIEARRSFESALRCAHTEEQAVAVTNALSQLGK